MHNFYWHNPTALFFGKDTVKELEAPLKADGVKGVLLVYGGKGTFKSGAYEQVTDMLKRAGIAFSDVNDVKPNPLISKVREGVARVKAGGIDAIMPIGGGSAFDTAKAIAAGAKYSGDVWDFYAGKAKMKEAMPIYGVLTASASSSEVNNISVISNPETQDKISISGPCLYPKASVIDPTFQFTLPQKQTVYGGVDIIAHLLERVLDGDDGSELMDEQSYALIRTMMGVIPELIDDPCRVRNGRNDGAFRILVVRQEDERRFCVPQTGALDKPAVWCGTWSVIVGSDACVVEVSLRGQPRTFCEAGRGSFRDIRRRG